MHNAKEPLLLNSNSAEYSQPGNGDVSRTLSSKWDEKPTSTQSITIEGNCIGLLQTLKLDFRLSFRLSLKITPVKIGSRVTD